MDRQTLTSWIAARGRELGFAAVGVAAVEPMDPAPLRDWLDAGYNAEMAYLRRHLPLRGKLSAVLPGARAVICAALPYPPAREHRPATARFARGRDYHLEMTARLQALWTEIVEQCPDAEGRVFVDAGPLPERELARRAGVGWIGKHGCLIHPKIGSRVVLGEILTTLDLAPTVPLDSTCGACRRCLDACPTGALVAPGVVDARRCLAYLTIEHRGAIPPELRPALGVRLFGCDACQDACPHNPAEPEPPATVAELIAILALTQEAVTARFRDTSLARSKRRGILRNACTALGNLGDVAALPVLQQALQDAEPLVREHAAWALARLQMHA